MFLSSLPLRSVAAKPVAANLAAVEVAPSALQLHSKVFPDFKNIGLLE